MNTATAHEYRLRTRLTDRERVRRLYAMTSPCRLCPRECGVERNGTGRGVCKGGMRPVVASVNVHHGEEPPISGEKGSGTIFFTGCNMKCVYCQNYPVSQLGVGNEITVIVLVGAMLDLQERGAGNINFVTPTHFAAQTAHAILVARTKGFRLPVVYNTSGYESVETLELLEGFVDVYLCDYRYTSTSLAGRFSSAAAYPAVIEGALLEMLRQVGPFAEGGELKGVIIRLLCLPGHMDETRNILRNIASRLGSQVPISLMSQFFPAWRTSEYPEINRRLNAREFKEARDMLISLGLTKGWVQEE